MTPVSGTAGRRRPAGFTLVEMLVVVVIIGMVAVGIILSLGNTGRDSAMEQERDRLVGLMAYVRERAELQTVEYGLHCDLHSYRFVLHNSRTNQWQEDILDDQLRARSLPAGLRFSLVIEGRPIVLEDPSQKDIEHKLNDLTPQVMLFSDGDLNSFEVTLQREGVNRTTTIRSVNNASIESGELVEHPT
jgi:general secretion pathway protein H